MAGPAAAGWSARLAPSNTPSRRRLFVLGLLAAHCSAVRLRERPAKLRASLNISGSNFVLERDGQNQTVQLHAGEVHYFRVPEVHWEDRLRRVRALGLNTVSTYVAWNWHEQVEGTFDFSSPGRNLTRFIELAQQQQLLVILRPGPYICAEWDFGGLPAWLLKYVRTEKMQLRTTDKRYFEFVDRFWSQLLPPLRPLLLENGGPVAIVQLENEYGYFGDAKKTVDRAYLEHLEAVARGTLGPNVLLITTDSPDNVATSRGTLPNVFSAINTGLGQDPNAALDNIFRKMHRHKQGPEFIMELWTGWFQAWNAPSFDEAKVQTPGRKLAAWVRMLLKRNASFTLYMAHGGTNFGFWASGTSLAGVAPFPRKASYITTSYDYRAPIAEDGSHGFGGDGADKFLAVRELLAERRQAWEGPLPEEPPAPRLQAYRGDGPNGSVVLRRQAALRDPTALAALCRGGWRPEPQGEPSTMEMHGLDRGYMLYRFVGTEQSDFMRRDFADATEIAMEFDQVSVSGSASDNASGSVPGSASGNASVNASGNASVNASGNATGSATVAADELALRVRDRVHVWQNDELMDRRFSDVHVTEEAQDGVLTTKLRMDRTRPLALDVLAEGLGRRAWVSASDRGTLAREWKGLASAKLGGKTLHGDWKACLLPLASLPGAGAAPRPSQVPVGLPGPAFYEGRFNIAEEPADTFLRLDAGAWQSGVAFINGFNLGRYFRQAKAPFDFYVPKSALRAGENVVVLLEVSRPGAEAADPVKTAVRLEAARAPSARG